MIQIPTNIILVNPNPNISRINTLPNPIRHNLPETLPDKTRVKQGSRTRKHPNRRNQMNTTTPFYLSIGSIIKPFPFEL